MKKYFFLIVIVILLVSGCVYYNTFFNAKKAFKEAENIRKTQKNSSGALSKYNIVIKKCAYIVKEYKNSKYADDALFLLSKALFYKGSNYTQAIENLEQLIEFYPESEFVPEAKIYIARSKYKLNKKEEAYQYLEKMLNSKVDDKYKAEALLLLAKYYDQDEIYDKAIEKLNTLIKNYPKSEQYPDALITIGKIYIKRKEYKKSLEVFEKIYKTKRFSKHIHLDAQYYIALNYYELKETEKALKIITKLLLKETRSREIPKLRMLNAKILVQKGEYDKAITLFQAIMKDNRRTNFSAEAAYYIGETYFTYLKNYKKAIEFYNKVKTEKNSSEFVEDAIIKSAISSQIIQYYNPTKNIDPLNLLNQQMKLGEYYFDILNQPDSTLKIYRGIFAFKDTLKSKLDSLVAEINRKSAVVDTTDSLNYKAKDELNALKDKEKSLINIMETYNKKILPKIYFNEVWLYLKSYKDTLKAKEIFNKLKEKFPESRARYAAKALLEGKTPRYITPKEKEEWKIYQTAIAEMDSLPQNALQKLKKISESKDKEISEKSKFALGYISLFVMRDTLNAKKYFDQLIDNVTYSSFIKKFYNGKKFTIIDTMHIPDKIEIDDDKSKKK